MQYIGIEDKNGKEIYEGDIISANDRRTWEVFISYGRAKRKDKEWCVDLYQADINDNDYEIIGNIYENPELLEVKS